MVINNVYPSKQTAHGNIAKRKKKKYVEASAESCILRIGEFEESHKSK